MLGTSRRPNSTHPVCTFHAYRNENILHKKSLNAVKIGNACKLPYFEPADALPYLTSDLHTSRKETIKTSNNTEYGNEMLVDRKIKFIKSKEKWLVFKKEGRWSTNQPKSRHFKAFKNSRPF